MSALRRLLLLAFVLHASPASPTTCVVIVDPPLVLKTLRGWVTDHLCLALPAASLRVLAYDGPEQSPIREVARTTADDLGYYAFPHLPPGTYTVVASFSGFNSVERQFVLGSGAATSLRYLVFSLDIGGCGKTSLVTKRQFRRGAS